MLLNDFFIKLIRLGVEERDQKVGSHFYKLLVDIGMHFLNETKLLKYFKMLHS